MGSTFHLQGSIILLNQVTDQLKTKSGSNFLVGSRRGFQLTLILKLFQDFGFDSNSGIGD